MEHNGILWNNLVYHETSLLELSRELQKTVTWPFYMGPLTIEELAIPVPTIAVCYKVVKLK